MTSVVSRDLHVPFDYRQSLKVDCTDPPGEMQDQIFDLTYHVINCVAVLLDGLQLFSIHAEWRALVSKIVVEIMQALKQRLNLL
jgi:hypothetical protein